MHRLAYLLVSLFVLTGCVTEKTIIVAAPTRTKPSTAAAVVKGSRVPYELWFDDTKWRREETPVNKTAEYEFWMPDAYGQVFVERITMPLETLQQTMVTNLRRRGAKDVTVVRQERRFVNGVVMGYVQMSATVEGVAFMYAIVAHAGPRGTIQVATFTGQSLFEELRKDMEDLLDGLVVKE